MIRVRQSFTGKVAIWQAGVGGRFWRVLDPSSTEVEIVEEKAVSGNGWYELAVLSESEQDCKELANSIAESFAQDEGRSASPRDVVASLIRKAEQRR